MEEEIKKRICDIAADLNNKLTVVLGNLTLIKWSENAEEMRNHLSRAEEACLQVVELVRKLFNL